MRLFLHVYQIGVALNSALKTVYLRFSAVFAFEADDCWRLVKPLTFMDRILSLQVYLVSSSSAAPWPGALPLQLRGPNYGDGDTNTFSKMMFELFTEYLTGWQICQVPLSVF